MIVLYAVPTNQEIGDVFPQDKFCSIGVFLVLLWFPKLMRSWLLVGGVQKDIQAAVYRGCFRGAGRQHCYAFNDEGFQVLRGL